MGETMSLPKWVKEPINEYELKLTEALSIAWEALEISVSDAYKAGPLDKCLEHLDEIRMHMRKAMRRIKEMEK
jgi:hypothetical protein